MMKYIIAIVVVLTIWGCENKETRLQSFLLKGNESFKEGDEEKALYYYNEALKIDACFVDALNNIGTIQHKRENFAGAYLSYSKAIECNPNYLNAWSNRANSQYESGEYYAALSDLDHVIKAKPDTSDVYFLRGLVLTKLRNYPEAINSFQKALDLGPINETDCRVNLASVKIFTKQYDDAKKELEACIKLNDKEPNIYNSLALIAIEKNDLDEALKQVNKAIELSPDQAYFINNRGFIYIGLGKFEEAKSDIDKSITIDPYNAWAYRNKGLLALKRKDYGNAEHYLSKAKGMDPHVEKVDEYLSQIPKKR
jgi:tetratricopeptide (TPR) repeat protein